MEVPELIPRKEINADVFTENNRNSDGSGIMVAIWDTGVDPSAAGLQVTSDGKPKIVDLIDASGSGDVKMRRKFRVSKSDRTVKTLTGRQVIIPDHWKPVDGVIRMGVKLASELFPRQLLQRLRSEAKDDVWLPCVKQLVANIAGDVAEAEEQLLESAEVQSEIPSTEITATSRQDQNPKSPPPLQQKHRPSCNGGSIGEDTEAESRHASSDPGHGSNQKRQKSASKGKREHTAGAQPSLAQCKNQLRSAARLLEDALSTLDRQYSPLEMVYDCFVFHDGSNWLSCVDTSPYNPGKTLADMPLLADYTVGRQFACFGVDTQLYFTVKILNEGKVLQIVTNDSGHGTHVAAMTAAYFPPKHTSSRRLSRIAPESDTPQRNGVAPGAQIVSIKISDSRLGSMETGVSLLRAIRWTVQLKCDVVNYSFGENCVWPNVGRLSKHLHELVHVHGVVMVASGGNNGPGLGTVGAPGASVDGLIGVAPLVFPDMMRGLYSQPLDPQCNAPLVEDPTCLTNSRSVGPMNGSRPVHPAAPAAYTWGSRGPALDGSLGLCVAAPGAANTSVASWQLRPSALLNGSSMSAPLVTGCVALLLSGIRHRLGNPANGAIRQTLPRIPPTLLRLAIMNTASLVPHLSPLDQGHGVIQVDKAFRYLMDALSDASDIPQSIDANEGSPNHVLEAANSPPRSRRSSAIRSASQSPSRFSLDPMLQSLTVPPDHATLFAMFGWRVQCTVSGPGCVYRDRGIWLRRGWLPRTHNSVAYRKATRNSSTLLPILRYTVHIAIHFDKSVPLEVRRRLELHLNTSVVSFPTTGSSSQPSHTKVSNKPTWLQIAPFVSVTSLGRDVSLVIDPNQFASWSNILPSLVDSSLSQPHSSPPMERKATNPEGCSNSTSSICFPSNLSSPFTNPVASTEPRVTMVAFSDSARPELGALAQVPITIHNPLQVGSLFNTDQPRFTFSDCFDTLHKVRRWFLEVPKGATAGVLRLARLDDNDAACEFKVTVCLPQPRSGLTTGQQEITWPLTSLNRLGRSSSMVGRTRSAGRHLADDFDGATQLAFAINWEVDYLELTIAQHWGMEQPATVIGELYFRGLEPSVHQLSMNSSDHYTRVVLRSNFATEDISPSISLTHWVLPLRPSESKIIYLGHGQDESLITQRGCYALRLVYQFSCPFKSSMSNFELPWLQELLYDSDYLVQLYSLYDWRGRFLGAGDYDLKRRKRQKFLFPLEKGDYKVIVQICHEQGSSLGSSHSQPGECPGTDTQNKLSGLNISVSGGDTPAPLERLRHHPALVRFRLPGPGAADRSDGPATGPRGSANSSAGYPVTFEFAAFAFSLGLNGSKPCSALDPIPCGRSEPAPTPIGGRQSYTNDGEHNMDANEGSATRRGELNRRCPCLPTSLGIGESTSVFIGLCDERYPSYVVRGSYYTGSISYYNSDVLQGLVTYPFRLVVDADCQAPPGTTTVKKDQGSDGDQSASLSVGCFGLSVEDFAWLQPLTDCVHLSLSPECAIRQQNASKPRLAHRPKPSSPTPTTAATLIRDTQAEIHSGPVQFPLNSYDDALVDKTSQLYEASDLDSVQTPSVCEQIKVSAPTPSVVHTEQTTSCANHIAEESTFDDSDNVTTQTQNSVPSQFLNNSPSDVNNVNQSLGVSPGKSNSACNEPNSPPRRRSLKINGEVVSPPIASSPSSAPSLSTRLAWIHEQLVQLDIPCRSTARDWTSIGILRSKRADLWSRADQLILGRSLGDPSIDDTPSDATSDQDVVPSVNPGSLVEGNFFQHLLTMRLVSSSSQSRSGSVDKVQKSNTPQETPPTGNKPLPPPTDRSDSEVNCAQSELDSSTQSTVSPTLKRASASGSRVIETAGSQTVKPRSKKDGSVHNYLELKLRLVDTLARYGRLLCERILLARFMATGNWSTHQLAAEALKAAPVRASNGSRWTLGQLIAHKSTAPIDRETPQRMRTVKDEDDEIRTYLSQIYSRLLQLTTSTTVGTSSVGERVEIGTHAIPGWLLASGVRELRTDLTDGLNSSEQSRDTTEVASWSCGTVGGRLLLFFLLYNVVEERFPQAVRLLTRLVYQIEESPTAALRGSIPCGSTPSIGQLRSVHATLPASLATAKQSLPWLIWTLRHIGWTEVAGYLEQQGPILFPEHDCSMMADFH